MSPINTRTQPVSRTHDVAKVGEANLQAFFERAIPSAVGAPRGLVDAEQKPLSSDAIAFQMVSADGQKRVDLAWDKKRDQLFMLKDGKMVEVPSPAKDAALDRLAQAGLKHTRQGSQYQQMRDDMLEARKSTQRTTEPVKKEPVLPKSKDGFDPNKDLYAPDEQKPEVKQPEVKKPEVKKPEVKTEQKPDVKTEQKPEVKTDVKTDVKTEQKPEVTKTEVKTEQKPTLTETDFLAQNSKRTVPTEALRAAGFDAASVRLADTDGDGAIRGTEWSALWKAVDRADKNGDGKSVDPTNARVKQRLDAVTNAKDGAAPYAKSERDYVRSIVTDGDVTELRTLTDAECAKKGLPRGTAMLEIMDPMGGGAGGGPVGTLNVYYHPSTDALFKELNNPTDGKDTPVVKMTQAEIAMFRSRSRELPMSNNETESQLLVRLDGRSRQDGWVDAETA